MKLVIDNKIIEVVVANRFLLRLLGLMGKKEINFGIYFPNCNSIHTFFMRENIDVLGLNEKNEIIFIRRNVGKNKVIKVPYWLKKTSILELPKNTSLSLKVNDKLKFND